MAKVRVIEVHENVFNTNNQEADALRKRLKDKKVTMINVMSSPGSGKTTLLSHVINEIKDDYKVGVMDVDIETSLDAQKVADFTLSSAILVRLAFLQSLLIYPSTAWTTVSL